MRTKPRTPTRASVKGGCINIKLGRSALAKLRALQADPELAGTVKCVTVQNKNNLKPPLPLEEVTDIFAKIGESCPNMESLQVALRATATGQDPAMSLPITALSAFFENAPQHLISLKLSGVISAASDQEFEDLGAAIRDRAPKSWKEVKLEFCEPSPTTPSLDPLLQALAGSGSLKYAKLSGTNITPCNTCTGPSLLKLLESNDLEILTIWGGKRLLRKEDTVALVRSLESNTCLRELTLHARGLCPTIGRALASSLGSNKTLERLILSISDTCHGARQTSKPSNYVVTASHLADALRMHNRTLTLLSLDYCMEEQETLIVGGSLDYDIDKYQLLPTRASRWECNVQQAIKAFTKMLHSNPVLEVLWINMAFIERGEDTSQGLSTSEMDMLLRLNRYGIRQSLFFEAQSEASGQDWLKALESQKDDLDALYYLLSRNPGFCCYARGTKRNAHEPIQTKKRLKTCR